MWERSERTMWREQWRNMVASKARDKLRDVPYGLESVIGRAYRDRMNQECV
jgi:hypothetical protein